MGLFDTVRCDYPLPVEGANALSYQTKSLDSGCLTYRISSAGRLLLCATPVLDARHDDAAPQPTPREEPQNDFIGEIRFYTSWGPTHAGWIEWSAYFVRGQLRELHLLRNTETRSVPDEA